VSAILALTASDFPDQAPFCSENTAWAIAWSEEPYAPRSSNEVQQQIRQRELRMHAGLLRDVVGSPFRQVALEGAWLTPSVVALARSIYEKGDFGGLPILADALEEAGCSRSAILLHCRQEGPHIRGCWAVDLILARK
jgi:hypothetical protein